MPNDELITALRQKLDEQARVSREMNNLLTKEGGLNSVSNKMQRDLAVCINVAKRPGYHDYFQVRNHLK